jgi:hypothetical protein
MIKIKHLHYLLFTLVFFQGLLELFRLPSFIYKIGVPLIILVLLGKKLLTRDIKKFPFYPVIIAFFLVTLLSYINAGLDPLSYVYFIVYTIFPYLYFVVVVNSTEEEEFSRISRYIVFLVLLQIPVSIVKFIVMGQSEQGLIGTLSTVGGSISTIFPLFAISFIFAKTLHERNWKYIIYIVGFIFMGLVGAKRAIGFYAPVIMVLIYLIYQYKEKSLFTISTFSNLMVISVIGAIFFYFSIRLNPSLNPENKIWGSFNLKFVRGYVVSYNTRDYSKTELQRVAAFRYFTRYLFQKKGTSLLIGEGPGKLVESKLKSDSGTMLKQYGVRYGGRTSFIWLWLQTGILGTTLYIGLILFIMFYLFKNYNYTWINLGLLGSVLVYLFDIFSYSNSFLKEFCLSIPFYFVLALHFNKLTGNAEETTDGEKDNLS